MNCCQAFHLETLLWVMSGCVAKAQLAIPGVASATRFVKGVVVDTKDPNLKEKARRL